MSVRLVDNKDTLKKVNDWRDPLYLNNLLTDKEKLIHKKAKEFCKTRLLPTVIDDNNKSFFDKKLLIKNVQASKTFDFIVFFINSEVSAFITRITFKAFNFFYFISLSF